MHQGKDGIRISKFLSLVLRHNPQRINLQVDRQGWALVEELLQKLKENGINLDLALLQTIVVTNDKKRFAFSKDGSKIRASQGHSFAVDLGYAQSIPPLVLYHGSAEKNREAILKEGLQKQNRQHVHLNPDKATAIQVGRRHGVPVVFEVAAHRMYEEGYPFYLSANGVWLTNAVPAAYLHLLL